MNVKHININGNVINIDDENAIQLPDIEPRDGDMLVYDETLNEDNGGFRYIQKSDVPDVEVGIIEGSDKLARSGDVYNAINAATVKECCYLTVLYDSSDVSSKKLVFQRANIVGNPLLSTNAKLLILSINTIYDQQQEDLKISNIIDILTLTPADTSVEKVIDDFSEDRMFYFLLFNDTPNVQICKLVNDRMLIAGVNSKTNIVITPTVSSSYPYPAVEVTASGIVDVDVNIILTLTRSDNRTEVITGTLLAGTSSLLMVVTPSGLDRNCNVSISPSVISSTQNYVLSNSALSLVSNVPRTALTITPGGQPYVRFTIPGTVADAPIDVKITCPRSGVAPVILTGTIASGNSYVDIDYTGVGFNGRIVYAEMGDRVINHYVEYYIDNSEVVLNVDSNGNPFD